MRNAPQAKHPADACTPNARPDAELTPDEIAARYGGHWGEHPRVPVSDWRYQVENGDTRRGYWDHVQSELALLDDDVA